MVPRSLPPPPVPPKTIRGGGGGGGGVLRDIDNQQSQPVIFTEFK